MSAARGQAPGQLSLFDPLDLDDGPDPAGNAADIFGRHGAAPTSPAKDDRGRPDDFGEKIGGARKDMWRALGDPGGDTTPAEEWAAANGATKDRVWKRPDYRKLHATGIPRDVLWYIKGVRDALPVRPASASAEAAAGYVRVVAAVRDAAMACRTFADCLAMASLTSRLGWTVDDGPRRPRWAEGAGDDARSVLTSKALAALRIARDAPRPLHRSMERHLFLMGDEDKALAKARIGFVELVGGKWSVRDGGGGRRVLTVRGFDGDHSMLSTTLPRGFDEGKLADGAWVVTRGCGFEMGAFPTREDARAEALKWYAPSSGNRAGTAGRRALVPPMLEGVAPSTGPDWRGGARATGEGMMSDFGIRGGEFGEWLDRADREASLDYADDALRDLACALGIEDASVSLGGRLALAFGARGHGGVGAAVAHYEPGREVINLTKLKGAGSLAHEWVHAMDDVLGKGCGLRGFMSEAASRGDPACPEAMARLMDAIKRRPMTEAEHAQEDARRVDAARRALEKERGRVEAARAALRADLLEVSREWRDEASEARRGELVEGVVMEACTADLTELAGLSARGKPSPAYETLIAFQEAGGGGGERRDANVGCPANRRYVARRMYELRLAVAGDAGRVEAAERALATTEDAARSRSEWASHPMVETDFYRDAKRIDAAYSGAGQQGSRVRGKHGYWDSDVELLARAGACYVKDRLASMGIEDAYLCGHADWLGPVPTPDGPAWTSPQGEERRTIDAAFGEFLDAMKAQGRLRRCELSPAERARESKERDCPLSANAQMGFDTDLMASRTGSASAHRHCRNLSALSLWAQ